jgi:drug/metabolite transporter (DMT)-like permease
MVTDSAIVRVSGVAEHHPGFPYGALALTVFVWGAASPLIKSADVGGAALSFYRLWIGALALILVLGALRRSWADLPWKWGAIAGVLFGLNLLFFVMAIKTTTVANATLIGALQPAIVLLVAGRWFDEQVSVRDVACVAVAIAGVGIVILGSTGSAEWNLAGDFLALLAVLTFTAYFLLTKRVRATGGTLDYMTVVHLIAALVVTPMVFADPSELTGLSTRDIAIVLFFALVSGTGGQLVVGWAHRYVDVSVSSLMLLGVPVVAAVAAWAMLDEALTAAQIAGGVITLVAIAVMVWRRAETGREAAAEVLPVAAGGD